MKSEGKFTEKFNFCADLSLSNEVTKCNKISAFWKTRDLYNADVI